MKQVFSTTAERDAFIDAHYPKRECLDTPGCYRLPDGSTLVVWCNEVEVHLPAPTEHGRV